MPINLFQTAVRLSCVLLAAAAASPAAAAGPIIVSQSDSMEVRANRAFTAFVETAGDAAGYQWHKDGASLAGEDDRMLVIESVDTSDAGIYRAEVTNASGATWSAPVRLTVREFDQIDIDPGGRGTVAVPGRLAYYDLSLPSGYGLRNTHFPVLLTHSAGGGGMVNHFRTVAEEKQWIVIGISQSRNGYGEFDKIPFNQAVLEHALDHLRIDPKRIFVGGMSGGGWSSFDFARQLAPVTAGVFSMGGWLGGVYSKDRDLFLEGLKVARANGYNDSGANAHLLDDRQHLERYLEPGDIEDFFFAGGHQPSPPHIQREVFDWLMGETAPSTARERDAARLAESHWKARVTAGEGPAVYGEVMRAAFGSPRTPEALAAMRALEFLFERPSLFLLEPAEAFSDFPKRDDIGLHLYLRLFADMQRPDPSRQISTAAAARAFGGDMGDFQIDPWKESETVLLHQVPTEFDRFILRHALYDRPELPYTGDWDGDGRSNFSEFALGGDPLAADAPPPAEIRLADDGVRLGLPRVTPGPWTDYRAEVADRPGGPWAPVEVSRSGFRALGEGFAGLGFATEADEGGPSRFFRLSAAPDDAMWDDHNGDGIPRRYQYPYFRHWSSVGPSDGGDDARSNTEFRGGPPLYLRYLTAAKIGRAGHASSSWRAHPALTHYRGSLRHEVWLDVGGSDVAASLAAVARREPNDVRLIKTTQAPWFNSQRNHLPGQNYFARTRGYVIPDESGNYVFSISGDDRCELWLSPDSDPANKRRIAHVPGATGYRQYNQHVEQTSRAQRLGADARYYVEILHKQGGGQGHCSVAWTVPGASEPELIPAANLAPPPAER